MLRGSPPDGIVHTIVSTHHSLHHIVQLVLTQGLAIGITNLIHETNIVLGRTCQLVGITLIEIRLVAVIISARIVGIQCVSAHGLPAAIPPGVALQRSTDITLHLCVIGTINTISVSGTRWRISRTTQVGLVKRSHSRHSITFVLNILSCGCYQVHPFCNIGTACTLIVRVHGICRVTVQEDLGFVRGVAIPQQRQHAQTLGKAYDGRGAINMATGKPIIR